MGKPAETHTLIYVTNKYL